MFWFFSFLCIFLLWCTPQQNTQKYNHKNHNSSIDQKTTPWLPLRENTPLLDPVETRKPNSLYQRAFKNQTRAPGIRTSFAPKLSLITDRLTSPWGIVSLPDGRLLVTEKKGNIRIVSINGDISPPLKNIPKVHITSQWWLLWITIDPDFTNNPYIYFVFSQSISGGDATTVAKGILSTDETSLEQVQILYQTSPPYNGQLHYGGRIVFDTDGYLIISSGERSDLSTRPLAQDLSTTLGKIIRIDTNGKPAPDNPHWNIPNAKKEIFTLGHRNPQWLALHPKTGTLWASEMWPRGGDEINILIPGENYGWPIITYGTEYNGEKVGRWLQHSENMQEPVYFWDPSVSPSGMVFYSGKIYPGWENSLFIGMLSGKHIARLVIDAWQIVAEERLFEDICERFRDITQATDGYLYTITDNGKLYKIDK